MRITVWLLVLSLLGSMHGCKTPELLYFEEAVGLPDSFIGHYVIDAVHTKDAPDIQRLTLARSDYVFTARFDDQQEAWKFLPSKIPTTDDIYLLTFPMLGGSENMFFIARRHFTLLSIWALAPEDSIVRDKFKDLMTSFGDFTATEPVKEFLRTSIHAYLMTNDPKIIFRKIL